MQVLPPMGFIKFNNQTDTYNVVLMPYFLTRRKWHTICTNSIHLSVSKLKNTFSRPVRVVWLKSTHVLRTFKATTAAPEIRVCGEFVLLHRTVDTPQFEREKQISTWLDGRDKRGSEWQVVPDAIVEKSLDERQSWSWSFHNAGTTHSLKSTARSSKHW